MPSPNQVEDIIWPKFQNFGKILNKISLKFVLVTTLKIYTLKSLRRQSHINNIALFFTLVNDGRANLKQLRLFETVLIIFIVFQIILMPKRL